MAPDRSHGHAAVISGHVAGRVRARGLCVQPESAGRHLDRSVDSSEVDRFWAPCLRRDAVTGHFKEDSRRAPQCWHADKPKFSREKGHVVPWKQN